MNATDWRFLYPDFQVRLRRVMADMAEHQKPVKPVCGYRSHAEQDLLFRKGRTFIGDYWGYSDPGHHGVVTYARPGESWHQYGVAADFCFDGSDFESCYGEHLPWDALAAFARGHGLISGADFPKGKTDRPHLEICYGFHIDAVRKFYHDAGMAAVWAAFDGIRGVPTASEWVRNGDQVMSKA